MNLHFYHCNICGKVIAVFSDTGVPTICCGQSMQELVPNVTDGVAEKHVPIFKKDGNSVMVQVGSVPHPMTDSHCITWIGLRTTYGFQMRELKPGDRPEACFTLASGDKAEAVYAYCNLHGLWRSEQESTSDFEKCKECK